MLALQMFTLTSSAGAQTAFPSAQVMDTPRSNIVTPQDFGAACDNSTDDGPALQAAVDYAQQHLKMLRIPRCSYVVNRQIIVSRPIDIIADPSANLRFTNPASCGFVLDLRAADANFGLNSVQLGGLYSPSTDPTFAFTGYPGNWKLTDRSACDGVTLKGGSRIDLAIKYVMGFRAGVSIEATQDAKNGARAPNNINLQINTADILEYGVRIDGGPHTAGTLAAINVEINTVFARYPVYFDTTRNTVGQVHINVTGQAFTNETNGACVYGDGDKLSTSSIEILWCYAGYSPHDSPQGTPHTLQLPYLAGSATSNGLREDGNGAIGYWGSSGNRISIGVASDQPALPGGFTPDGNMVVRVRDAGKNELHFPFAESPSASITLPSQAGEARFANGIAVLANAIPAHVEVPPLAPGASTTFYAYDSSLSPASQHSIRVVPQDNTKPSGLQIQAIDDAANANRQIRVVVQNTSSNQTKGWSGNVWLKID